MLGGFKLSRSYQTRLSFSRSISSYAEQLLNLFSLQNGMLTQPMRSSALAVWADSQEVRTRFTCCHRGGMATRGAGE